MKRLLIISPYFAPSNAADTHRIRMSLPYFEENGWQVEVVACNPKYYENNTDELLLQSIPKNITIHYVNAFSKKYTAKIGLGSLALRSLWFYKQKVNQLLKTNRFDLIYFSTTQFPVCILGAYWKKKFKIPYIIDMQDPWHSDYYKNKPKNEQPPKYWFSYRLNKYLEPFAIKNADGLISVSQKYLNDLNERYPKINPENQKVITFGYSDFDLKISEQIEIKPNQKKTLMYLGVLGPTMYKSLDLLFRNLSEKIKSEYHLVFKGTSYANAKKANKSTTRFQNKYHLKNIEEHSDRIGMFQVLKELSVANGLLIIGTDDPGYTASKLYPYLQVRRPILAILHPNSSANEILKETSNAIIINLDDSDESVIQKLNLFITMIENDNYVVREENLKKFSARTLTECQCQLFNRLM